MRFLRTATLALSLPLLALACGGDDGDSAADAGAKPSPRARSEKLREAQGAVERGLTDVARTLFDQLEETGVDAHVLEHRLCRLEGDEVAAMRLLEEGKETWPDDGRIWAAETEFYAALDRIPAAEEALKLGFQRVGKTPELERAHGILLLAIPGGSGSAMEYLERALEMDPELPYAQFPLAQAQILSGRLCIKAEEFEVALGLARAALKWDSADPAARELLAEACMGLHAYEDALEIYGSLEETTGRDYRATRANLHWRSATTCLHNKRRDEAVEHYLAARRLGLDDEELGFGARVLAEEAQLAIDRGVAAYDREGDLATARREFERALELDPHSMAAHNHLGVILFRLADYEAAARAWGTVLADAARTGAALPEPVHLNLARAWHLAGQSDRARDVLSNYIDREPEGEWIEDTRDLLFRLEAAALEDR